MKLELTRRAAYHWIQTTQLDRDEARSLPHVGGSI